MNARMRQPAIVVPEAMQALLALSKASQNRGVPQRTLYFVQLRASQINGCSFCVDMHARELVHSGAKPEHVFAVAAWQDAPYFTDAERAALALTDAVTRLADASDAVPDALWDEVKKHYDETALAALLLAIASINVWNRLNVPTRQPAGRMPAHVA
jgi:AhpD family alkylhydroperoxidase